MIEDNEKSVLPPYASFATVKNFIAAFRGTGLPSRIDKGVMSKLSGAAQSRVTLALKYLKLIKSDLSPTPALEVLAKGTDEAVKKQWAELAKSYTFVFQNGLKLDSATDQQLQERFKSVDGLSGDTINKAMTFFVLMATEGGMTISPFLKSAKRKSPSNGGAANRRKKSVVNPPDAAKTNEDDDTNTKGAQHTTPEGHLTYELDLDMDGKRIVKVTAPKGLKSEDIERTSGWMRFQWNVAWKQSAAKNDGAA